MIPPVEFTNCSYPLYFPLNSSIGLIVALLVLGSFLYLLSVLGSFLYLLSVLGSFLYLLSVLGFFLYLLSVFYLSLVANIIIFFLLLLHECAYISIFIYTFLKRICITPADTVALTAFLLVILSYLTSHTNISIAPLSIILCSWVGWVGICSLARCTELLPAVLQVLIATWSSSSA